LLSIISYSYPYFKAALLFGNTDFRKVENEVEMYVKKVLEDGGS